MLYVKILEKLLNERDVKRSQYAQVKRICEATIQDIKTILQDQQVLSSNNLRTVGEIPVDKVNNNEYEETADHKCLLLHDKNEPIITIDSEKFWIPLEIACQGDSPRITVLALDGIQKLIAHGQLTGNYPNLENPSKRLIDRVVETICSCFNITPETDENVELQIIKALLTIVTSQHVQIHEGTLLLTMRTILNIFLTTKNTINQTTSRAMLTQMLHCIFTRVEAPFEGLVEESDNVKISPDMLDEITSSLENWEGENVAWFTSLDFSSFFFSKVNPNHLSNFSIGVQEGSNVQTDNNSTITAENVSNISQDDSSTNQQEEQESSINIEEGQNKEIISEERNSAYEIQQNLSHINNAESQKEIVLDNKKKNYEILQKDAFLVFWAVCKVKAQHIEHPTNGDELSSMLETKSKKLSFQLLKSVLENCGPVFQTNAMFVTAVKQYLYEAMVAAAVSPIQEIYQLNVDLLMILIEKFKSVMLDELAILIQEILFPVLDNSTFPIEYKLYALGAIHKLFKNFKSLLELFIYHDCRESVENGVFERMVTYTCKFTNPEKFIPDSGALSTLPILNLAIEALICLLQKMTNCVDKLKERRKTVVNFAPEESVPLPIQEAAHENLSSEFVDTLMTFLENVTSSTDVFEIDVMIQTIAQNLFEKWNYSENLASADALYVLMYSSINLVGELSSKYQARGKVTKEKSNVEETLWYKPLPSEFLTLVHTNIEAYLKQYRKHHNDINSVQSQSLNLVHNAHRLINLVGLQQPSVLHEKHARSVRKMFKIVAKPMLNALVGALFSCDDTNVTDLCLSGIQYAIHITSALNLKNERDAFVQSLSRLSMTALKEILNKTSNALVVRKSQTSSSTMTNGITKSITTTITETKCRNVDIIQTLLNVAIHEGNYLSGAWLDTLKCISQLEASELMGRSSSRRSSSPSHYEVKSWYEWAGSLVPSFWDNSANKLDISSVKESIDQNVNLIFLNSTKLDDRGIAEFFKALCQVSLIEITHPENPRSFVYEKIFEVSHINIHRSCLQWCNIWQVLSEYFSHLACSSDEDISFFAIDSISKLVVNLLEKENFGNFRFQSQLFKTFETIMQNTPFISTRAYVLESINKIMKSNASKLRSGWITVFRILESSIYHDDSHTAAASFMALKNILKMFESSEINLETSYCELLRCFKDLAFKGPHKTVRVESLKMIKQIANLVHTKEELFVPLEIENLNLQRSSQVWLKGWLPIFRELSDVIIEAEEYTFSDEDQANSLQIIFELIKDHGEGFEKTWWQSLFNILFIIFDKLKYHRDEVMAEDSINHSTKTKYNKFYCYYYVQFAIVDTYIKHYDVLEKQELGRLLQQLKWCIQQGHEQVALSGVQCLHQIIRMLHLKLTEADWKLITEMVNNLLHNSSQISQVNVEQWNPLVQIELLKVVKTILLPIDGANETKETMSEADNGQEVSDFCETVGKENQFMLLDALEERMELMRSSFSHKIENETDIQIENTLQMQETLIMDTYLRFLIQMYFNNSWSNDEFHKIETRFTNGVLNVLNYFVKVQPTATNRLTDLTQILTFCIQNVHLKVSKEKFEQFSSIFYPKLCDLLELELESPLTGALAKYFLAVIRAKIENGDLNALKM